MTALRRIEWEDLPASLADALRPRVERLGYLGEFFKCAAHQPRALGAFIAFTEASKEGLPNNLVETIALTCAAHMENNYERAQHEQLCLKRGFDRDWVRSVIRLQPDAPASPLSPHERDVQRLVLTMLATNGKAAGPSFDRIVVGLGEAQAIAVLMVVGRYVVHALIVNTLALAPPVPSIFEEGAVP